MIRKHHSQPKPLMGKPLICNSKPLFRLNPPLTILSDLLAGNPPTVSATKGPFKLCSVHFSAPRVSTAQGWASNDESLPVFSCSPLSLGPAVPLICWHSYPCWVSGHCSPCQKKVAPFYWPATCRHQPKRIPLQVARAVICITTLTSKCCFSHVLKSVTADSPARWHKTRGTQVDGTNLELRNTTDPLHCTSRALTLRLTLVLEIASFYYQNSPQKITSALHKHYFNIQQPLSTATYSCSHFIDGSTET